MQEAGRTPWDVLGVAESALYSEIKRAFFRRARSTHPDAPGGSAEAFREVQAAFEALQRITPRHDRSARPSKRTPYDSWLSRPKAVRQWSDEDPLLDDLKPNRAHGRGGTFAYLLGAEISRLHLQAA
jgi:curved DNA-binding protein CbpA